MTQQKVRTRFAPSPTGYMHIGNLRTALYAYLYAKSQGGDFILRIEDTDRTRYVADAVDFIERTLKLAGIVPDEGPGYGGDCGPYVQSERLPLYKKYAEELVKTGHAYYCFCDPDEDHSTGEFGGYDRTCRDLPQDVIDAHLRNGDPYVIRQKMPLDGATTYADVLHGSITIPNSELEDQVLLKRDGMPTYNFANVIDDHLMGITHVVRGSEYLSSAPKYNLLYEGFGWPIPRYVHCSPVMRDAHNKMSKRHGDPSYEDLIAQGFLTDAVINYVTLLGWSPKGEQEFFTMDELVDCFDLSGISKSPAIFDIEKLRYFNSAYIRAMSAEDFAAVAAPWIRKAVKNESIDPAAIAALLQQRTEILSEIPEKLDFFDELPEYSTELFVHKKSKSDEASSREVLRAVIPVFEALENWDDESILNAMVALAGQMEAKNAKVMWPVRIAAAGKAVTPGGAVEICRILGREETLRRLRIALEKLEAL